MSEPSFIGVDWGSTNLRAYLIDDRGDVLDSARKAGGLLNVESGQFESVLSAILAELFCDESLPVLLCGMVGSQQGWREASYASCPATAQELAENLTTVPNSLARKIAIVPGVSGNSLFGQHDVMRGEETQIFGALDFINENAEQKSDRVVMCLPGTHSKWVLIDNAFSNNASITSFATCMTGELHSVLMQHSILGRTVDRSIEFSESAFDRGLESATDDAGLLHRLFSARSSVLNNSLETDEVSSYLSGLLIGEEINRMREVTRRESIIYMVGDSTLSSYYQRGLKAAGKQSRQLNAVDATRTGLFTIARNAGFC